MKSLKLLSLLMVASISHVFSQTTTFTPFAGCPTDAFQVITANAATNPHKTVLYGINISTGAFSVVNGAVELGTPTANTTFNAIGYSTRDNIFYGYDQITKSFYKMDKFGNTVGLLMSPSTVPDGNSSSIGVPHALVCGDVSPDGTKYFVSHNYSKYIDVYDIPALSSAVTTLTLSHQLQIVDNTGTQIYLRCNDFAFNPVNGKLYAYTSDISANIPGTPTYESVIEITIDLVNNKAVVLPYLNNPINISAVGGVGACYFDVNGNFYAGFNNGTTNSAGQPSGIVYKFPNLSSVPVGTLPPTIPFSYQPVTNFNDGARCLNAPETVLDFGDAPDSYRTNIFKAPYPSTTYDDPARHDLTSWFNSSNSIGLVLGTGVTSENDGKASINATGDTDDGIAASTSLALKIGTSTIIPITVSGDATSLSNGKLSIWIDLNGDGLFTASEEVVTDKSVVSGINNISVAIPSTATLQSNTYMRIRLSTIAGLLFYGPAPDGEVEDYAVSITPNIKPVTENGTVSSPTGGIAIANIASNDSVNGVPAILGPGGNATVAPSSTWPTEITLDPSTGKITVAPGTVAGIYPISYTLCDLASPTPNCTSIVDTIFVTPTPDTVIVTPACPTCPVKVCTIGDDIADHTGATYSSCGTPAGYTQAGPDANGCYTYTPTSPAPTTTVTTCQVICKNGICDTTYVIINPPITPDTVIVTPACPTCPVKVCTIGDDIADHTGATYSSCGTPAGYTQTGPDANGCYTYTPTSPAPTTTVTTCQVICKNGICDTTYVIINPPKTSTNPDFNVTNVDVPVNGNVNTNDVVTPGTQYGTPVPVPGNPSSCTPTIATNGTYTFVCSTPGVFKFNVPVCPPGVSTNCPTQLLTITVLDPTTINPPVANTDQATTKQDSSVNINVLSNDNTPNLNGGLGTPSIITPPKNGTASVNPDGTIKYTPNPGFSGKDTLTYQVCDTTLSPQLCATAIAIIDVLPPTAPNTTAAADDYNTVTDIDTAKGNVLLNDTDPEHNTQTVTPINSTLPQGHIVIDANGNYTFTPTPGVTGPVDIVYTVCDNGNPQACAQATLHILVTKAVPDITPVTTIFPTNFIGQGNFVANVKVYELLGKGTTGPITILLTKNTKISVTFNPSMTMAGGSPVNNSIWTFDGTSSPLYYIFRTNEVINANNVSSFGFNGVVTPGAADGKITISTIIDAGSGGEVNVANNIDADILTYFLK